MSQNTDWRALTEETAVDRRRERRVTLRYSLTVTGVDASGRPFCDDSETVNVSEEGCCFALKRPLAKGDLVSLRVNRGPVTGEHSFKVMWIVPNRGAWLIGARLLRPENVWGMTYPPKGRHSPESKK